MAPAEAMSALKLAVLAFHQKPAMAKAALPQRPMAAAQAPAPIAAKAPGVVVNITPTRTKRYVAAPIAPPARVAVAVAR
jgi:hypothetical protein